MLGPGRRYWASVWCWLNRLVLNPAAPPKTCSCGPSCKPSLALKSGGYFFMALRGQREAQTNSYDASRRRLGFDERRLTMGYEHFWNEHWSGGGTARLEATGYRNLVLVPEVLLRHRSAVGPLTFGQRLSLERTFPNNAGYVGGPGPDGQTWARLRVDLEKVLPLARAGRRSARA
ncbi:hypothetical protein ACFQT0_08615 [Hymenobacter humi]|uniref:Alginate export domain-containing protein n=1 Tax=Hymenobacter humi TaxID=1411620 RepID=A0ABW2U3I6_9BACT